MKTIKAWAVLIDGNLFERGVNETAIYKTRSLAREIKELFPMDDERVVRVTIAVEEE